MTENANLFEKYNYPSSSDGSTSIEQYQSILAYAVNWENYEATKKYASLLKELKPTVAVPELKNYFAADRNAIVACMEALRVKEDTKARQSILTVLYDMLRYDSSCFSFYERALDEQVPVFATLLGVIREGDGWDVYISDKAAWLLTIVIGHRLVSLWREQVFRPHKAKVWVVCGTPTLAHSRICALACPAESSTISV